ncbi:MAG: hypothetical protein QM736_18970 [Vicinamibacterales bacterium]
MITLLADGGGRTAALSLLHQRALQVTGGSVSLLFEPHPASGRMQATSGAGVDALPGDAWEPAAGEAAILTQVFAGRSALALPDLASQMPALHAQVGTASAILLPLVTDTARVGLLAIGLAGSAPPAVAALDASDVRPGFLVALELSRLRQRIDFEQDVRDLLDAFAERLASTLNLPAALAPLCAAVTRLFAADRTTVWVHQRESKALVPLASSDVELLDSRAAVRTDNPVAPAAAALRAQRSGLATSAHDATSLLSIPLRGCRRALGTIVCEGVRIEPGDDIALLNRRTNSDGSSRALSRPCSCWTRWSAHVRSSNSSSPPSPISSSWSTLTERSCARIDRSRARSAPSPTSCAAGRSRRASESQLIDWLDALPAHLAAPAVCELTDDVLGGPYAVTVTELPAGQGRPSWRVLVASDLLPVLAMRMPPG